MAFILVGATTALIRRKVQRAEIEVIPDDLTLYEKPSEEEEEEEKDANEGTENLNVLHLLYTIAQVRPCERVL